MPNFSFFWRKHYHEIGNCCMTYPLEGHIYIDPDHAKAAAKFGQKQLVKDFIDVGWMSQKGLKWIGWDIQGWLAWTDPNGMLYRIKDLKRNEDGVAFEKEVNEVKSELKPRTHQGNPSAEALYRFERDMQKDCGFCPGDRRGSVDPEVDRKPGMDAQPEEEINLDDLMKGDYSPFVPGGYNGVIDQEEITTTGFVTYGGYIDEWGGGDGKQDGGIVKQVIDPVAVLPPKPLPIPPEKQTPPGKRGLPDMPKRPTDTDIVTQPVPNPIDKLYHKPPFDPGGEITFPTPRKPTAKPAPKMPVPNKPTAKKPGNQKTSDNEQASSKERRNLRSDAVKVTFDSGADNPVSSTLADYFEKVMEAAAKNGVKSVNISSTTNHPSNKEKSAHSSQNGARALDINKINDEHVSTKSDLSQTLQQTIQNVPGWREHYGPYIIQKIEHGKVWPAPWARRIKGGHYDHIHISVL